MKKLWQKNIPEGKASWELDSFIESFETKDDIIYDQKLIMFDVYASLAHAKMLCKIGILTPKELSILQQGLLEILNHLETNKFELKPGDEDVHTKIRRH